MKTNYRKTAQAAILGMAMVMLSSCSLFGEDEAAAAPQPNNQPGSTSSNGNGSSSSSSQTQSSSNNGKNYKQIERLGRPAINEGLVITNDFLNAYNSIPPTVDLTPPAAAVVAEAAAVLQAVGDYGRGAGLPAPQVGDVAAGFLPDVMRIDTRVNIAVGSWAYNGDAVIVSGTSAGAMLTAGRKLEDDVMDITLSYLIAGNPACGPGTACTISDGVSYAAGTTCATAGTGSNPGNPGHKCLQGQTARNGSASFPYLARPN